ncbi:SAF domain-containing protein [Jonesia denitrificans]|uniref:SAF domain protein n=1 Tax=Jonesia denitrificans (strain ATCC 14870 / DSM 20603 / BCRC 15368 / CIP 55.134 / JCM 11481 / NBRC 15587 / NCTC 10816 / Prevot 55134) TaxID=471856 RepID=C7QZG2_JONDD|nr:SAF domain-containing protein [Jonesia denitrificans]ACV09460.1 SAF domain protein [Jonesia denitrificans DSM 20603]QXB43842.1 SAF domain-containing protein [Jonesia denitrificans]SQH21817.1 Uncharacterised protein [Jonesia denitrificans]
MPSTSTPGTTPQAAFNAPRMRQPSLRDPRLPIGIVLVALSVWIGAWALDSGRTLDTAFVAARTLQPGDAITEADLQAVDVELGQHLNNYLTPETMGEGLVAVVPVHQGQLVAVTSTGSAADVDSRIMAVPITGQLPAQVVPGSTIDLWYAPEATPTGEVGDPDQVASGLTVSQIPDTDSVFGVSGTSYLHVVVPQSDIPAVLAATQAKGALTALPVPHGDGSPAPASDGSPSNNTAEEGDA